MRHFKESNTTMPMHVDDRPIVNRPFNLSDRELIAQVFLEDEHIARGGPCLACGATWVDDAVPHGALQSRSLWHRDDCLNLAIRDQAYWTDIFDSYLDVASDLFGDETVFRPVSTNELVGLATRMWRRDVGLEA